MSSERAQSETVGVLLMTGVVITLMAVLGVAMTSNVTSQMETGPQIDLEGNATKDDVTLEHAGGTGLEVSELEVVLQGDSTERYDLASFIQRRGIDARRFEPADRWQRDHGLSGDTVDVLLVHTPSGTIAGRTVLELAATGPFFEVGITDTNSPIEQGDALEVEVDVENTGIETGTQNLGFSFDGTVEETESVTLSPSQRTSRTFTFDTSGVDPGTYTVAASTDNRTDERTVTVEEPTANITVTAVEGLFDETITHTYQPNVTLTESADVETDGLEVELIIEERGGATTAFQELKTASVDFDEIRSGSLTVDFDVGQRGANSYNYFATASADNAVTHSKSGEFVVGEPAFFNVTIDGTNSPTRAGEIATVDVTVNNSGGVTGTKTVQLSIDGATADSQSVTLAPDESQTIRLEWQTESGDQNNSPYTATVSSDDDSESVQITVESGGGGQRTSPTVTTQAATEIGASSATLNGELADLGTANNVNVYFEYSEDGETWTSTASQRLGTSGTFNETVSDLSSGTEYQFRAVAETNNDGSDTGDNLSFTTNEVTLPAFESVAASDVDTGGAVTQTFTFMLSNEVESGDEVEINLDDAYDTRGGKNTQIIYPNDAQNVTSDGDGSLSIVTPDNQQYSLIYTVGSNDPGSEIKITVEGIDTSESNDSAFAAAFTLDRGGDQQDSDSDTFSIVP